jgi:hypothetical protein
LKRIIAFLFLLNCCVGFSQKNYPTDYFRSPLDIPIVVSGTFGELRSNHFHAGLDIKTQRKNGLNVYAAADGYVSRIKVALWGYGKVIYVTHPNGYTSVYAHLSKFGEGIEEYVKKIQYRKKRYETGNIFPKKGEIPVKKGQIIAYSGSTGGFVAPHLHFEIRDSKTEHIINPLLFGYKVEDSLAPRVTKLMGFPLKSESRINGNNKKLVLPIKRKVLKDSAGTVTNVYKTNRITALGKIAFGITTWDRLGTALNKNGVYSIEMKLNGNRHYYHDLETFSFAESKFINLLIDYAHYKKYRNRVQRTYRHPANKLSIYEDLVSEGIINVEAGLSYLVEIIIKDFKGNTSTVTIPILGKESEQIFSKQRDTTKYKIVTSEFHKFTEDGVTVGFPKYSFYDDFYLDFSVKKGVAKVHRPNIPLHKSFTITFDSTMYNPKEIDQLYIANINNKKYPSYQNTRKKKNKMFTTTKTLGKYTILKDSIKPKIYNPNFQDGSWMTNHKYLSVRISDAHSGIKSYEAFIDDEWILMEYDLKKKKLSYDFSDKKLVGSKHIFKLVVSDNVGNTNTYSSTFYRK